MNKKKFNKTLFSLVFLIILNGCTPETKTNSIDLKGSLFKEIPSSKSNVDFSNFIPNNSKNNFMSSNIIIAGGGAAIGDINNDGLQDIFFISNQNQHALYLNKGNFEFENIIKKSNIKKSIGWSTGVTMVDINQDGYIDIYINKGGDANIPVETKENLLYINNGDLTFTEKSSEYGLNDSGASTMTTFFDADQDGDLDAYVLNYLTYSAAPSLKEAIYSRYSPRKRKYSDNLYIQESPGHFVKKTEENGVFNYSHGLGLAITDINLDNRPDIYISNDFYEADYLYLNAGKGKYKDMIDRCLGHISYFSMGVDVGDINNDGLVDIFTVEMAPKERSRSVRLMKSMDRKTFEQLSPLVPQYMRNSLQLNRGNGIRFSEIAQYAGVPKTDWSWSTIIQDLDDDGLKDIFVTNGIQYDVTDRDFVIKSNALAKTKKDNKLTMQDVNKLLPSTPLRNYAYKNNGDLTFSDKSNDWGFDFKGFSNGMAFGDLDNDGDLDLIINNINDKPLIYKNTSRERGNNFINFSFNGKKGNKNGLGCKVTIYTTNGIQFQEMYTTHGFQSSSQNIVHFGLGSIDKVDKVEIVWPDNTKQTIINPSINKTVKVFQDKANETYANKHLNPKYFIGGSQRADIDYFNLEIPYDDFEKEVLLPHKLSQMGPFSAVGDVNGDKKDDLYIGGSAQSPGQLYLSLSSDISYNHKYTKAFEDDKKYEDMQSLFFDADNDGDLDLYVVSGSNEFKDGSPKYQDRLYLNDGQGNFSKANSNNLPKETQSGSCVVANDFDNDGDLDLFVGGRIKPGKYPYSSKSMLLENTNGKFKNVIDKVSTSLEDIGMVTSAIWSDYDKDGDKDLLVVGEWMSIHVFKNNNGKLEDVSKNLGLEKTSGWWNKIIEWDFDGDGDMDYAIGNIGLNHKFKASSQKPFQLFANDFDNSGSLDIVLAYGDDKNPFPVRGRDCTSEQMPFITEKFPTFKSFGSATVKDIFEDDKLKSAIHKEAQIFASIVLENTDTGFNIIQLPVLAQLSAINGLISYDITHDGLNELLVAGNMYETEAETSRADASVGIIVQYDSKTKKFSTIDLMDSGWFCPGDTKDIKYMKNSIPYFVVTNNNSKAQIYTIVNKK